MIWQCNDPYAAYGPTRVPVMGTVAAGRQQSIHISANLRVFDTSYKFSGRQRLPPLKHRAGAHRIDGLVMTSQLPAVKHRAGAAKMAAVRAFIIAHKGCQLSNTTRAHTKWTG